MMARAPIRLRDFMAKLRFAERFQVRPNQKAADLVAFSLGYIRLARECPDCAGNIERGMANHRKGPDGSRGHASHPGLGARRGDSTPRKLIDETLMRLVST